jgi:glycosyltransferase involved in cell wall biosynthesis
MNILYVITQGECGGAQVNVRDMAIGAKRSGARVHVAVGHTEQPADSWLFSELKKAGFTEAELIVIPELRRSINPIHDVAAFFSLWRLAWRLRPDIVHLHSSKAGSVGAVAVKCAGWMYAILSFGSILPQFRLAWRPKVVYTVHGFVVAEPLPGHIKLFYIVSEFIASYFRDLVITVSARDQHIGRRYHLIHSRSVVIYNGLDTARQADIFSFSAARQAIAERIGASRKGDTVAAGTAHLSGKKIVGTISNIYLTKGLAYLIDAAHLLRDDNDLVFVVIGDGDAGGLKQELLARIKELKLTDRFFFIGSVPEAYRYIPAFDLFVLASVKEGFPYVLLEALMAGRPFVATNVGGIPELAGILSKKLPDKPAHLVPAGSAQALAAAINNFFQRPAPASVSLPEDFTLARMITATLEEYRRLMHHH